MSNYDYALLGLHVAIQPYNLLFCFLGVLFGTLTGVLPGLGPVAAIALLLPLTYHLEPVTAIIMLSGLFYGCMYGGSTTSILVNIPGEAASVVTCLDGYQMARKGRAGVALGMSAFGSFIAGTIGVVTLMLIATPMSKVVLSFGPPEYFSLMAFGMTLLIYLAHGSKIKAVIMICFGLFLSTVGIDVLTGKPRFIFGSMDLADGIGMVPILMGIFGITEVLVNIETIIKQDIYETKIKNLLPNLQDWRDSIWAILRGTGIGFFLGLFPGGGAIIASFASYAIEKKISKHPEKFGTGVIEGVAGPESANNAATSSGYVPLFILGIPVNPVMAMLFSAMLIHGMQPGPLLLQRNPEMFWGTVMSMYIGNVILLILNLPLIGIWVRLLKIPYEYLFPLILLFCLIGSYTINNSATDVFVMLVFGMVGYLMRKFNYEGAPMVLALVLGPMIEQAFIQSLNMSAGSYQIFFERPVSAATLILAFIITTLSILPSWRRKPEI